MNKLTTFALSTVLAMSLAVPALAGPYDTDKTLPVDGFIGIDTSAPGYDPDKLIDVTYTASGIKWVVDQDSWPKVSSANYIIQNNSPKMDLKVTMRSFTWDNKSDQVKHPPLTLKFTGDLFEQGITDVGPDGHIVGLTNSKPFSKLLQAADDNDHDGKADANGFHPWTYGFTGQYDAKLTKTPLQPKYNMVLSFEVV
ncbi:MAG: hypothetical protein LBR39_00960 [Coriobacteriales bacterium]|jgi:hypothetical protein|nr:hypothetical protein [Coriobacteriales bacterium]